MPAAAAAEEAFSDEAGVALFPEEEAFTANAADRRRREFTTARACARAALVATVPGTHRDRMLVSAKECLSMAWFPLTRRWLGFEDVSVTIDPEQGTFTARLLVDGPDLSGVPLTGFTGRWLADDGLIITAIAVLPS